MTVLTSRIPLALQAVFLSSNSGNEVNKPPPDRSAFKMFTRSIFARKRNVRVMAKKPKEVDEETIHSTSTSREVSPNRLLVEYVKQKNKPKVIVIVEREPQDVLDALVYPLGYDTTPYASMKSAYWNKPTEFQMASYSVHLKDLITQDDVPDFSAIMGSGLVSRNPCNSFSESLFHLICRQGRAKFAQAMVDCGASVQIADDYGRTPMHDLCWCPRTDKDVFAVADILLARDNRLFYIMDKRGNVPLDYVKDPANKNAWAKYIESRVSQFWPQLEGRQGRPALCDMAPNSLTLNEKVVSLGLASQVASGQVDATMPSEDDDDFDSDSDDDSDYDSEDSDDSEFEDEELIRDIMILGNPVLSRTEL